MQYPKMDIHNSRCYPLQVIPVRSHKMLPKTNSRFQLKFSVIYLTECIKFVPCVDKTWCTVSRII